MPTHRVHGIQVYCCLLRRLATGKKADARNGGRHRVQKAPYGTLCDLGDCRRGCEIGARKDHVGLQNHALEQNTVLFQLLKGLSKNLRRNPLAQINVMVTVHEDLWLDDGHNSRLLAKGGVSSQSVRVGADAIVRGEALSDGDYSAPLGEACPELSVFSKSLAESIETLGDFLTWEASEVSCSLVNLDPRQDPLFAQDIDERSAFGSVLPQGLIKENDAADVIGEARGCK